MKSTARNTLIVGSVTLMFCVTAVGAFVAGANPRSRASILDEVYRGHPIDRLSSLDDRETMRQARVKTAEILEARDDLLSTDQQKDLLGLWTRLKIWDNMWFLGIRIKKNPVDLWTMGDIIFEVRPDFIIETGTDHGGSALYWAATLELLGLEDSRVITFDIADRTAAASEHYLWQKYVEFVHSSSTDPEAVGALAERVEGKSVIVTLDSDHRAHHVLQELRMYGPLVSPGSYLIVEDTNMDGVPVAPAFGPGPTTALNEYLDSGGSALFEQDASREAYILTFNPAGWLRRRTE